MGIWKLVVSILYLVFGIYFFFYTCYNEAVKISFLFNVHPKKNLGEVCVSRFTFRHGGAYRFAKTNFQTSLARKFLGENENKSRPRSSGRDSFNIQSGHERRGIGKSTGRADRPSGCH